MKIKTVLILAISATILSCSCNKKNVVENQTVTITTNPNNGLIGKWKLIEINGIKIENSDYFIQFSQENRYSAFAGCNNFGGEYQVQNGTKITFTKGMSTMMACQNMQTEQELANSIEKADNYVQNGNTLTLNKAKMAPLLRLEKIK